MTTDHKNVPPEMSAKLQEIRDVFGSVPSADEQNRIDREAKQAIRDFCGEPRPTARQAGAWFWLCVAAGLVATAFVVANAAPLAGVAL